MLRMLEALSDRVRGRWRNHRRPRFSVVIPTHNRASCLRRALESLVSQTCQDFEVLVVDDGSTDGTPEVVAQFEHRLDVRYFREERWGGPARPRNVGIARARADWVCFLDSDDWWYPRKLELCLPHLDENDVVYHTVEVATPHGLTGVLVGRDVKRPVFVDLMTGLNAVPNSASMARRAILRRVGGFSEDKALIAVEDYDLWLRVARHTERFHRVAETLGVYWDGGGGHNLSASEAQIATEVLVFARHRKDLTAEQDREAQRNWRLRHEAMRAPTVDDQARARLSRDEFGVR